MCLSGGTCPSQVLSSIRNTPQHRGCTLPASRASCCSTVQNSPCLSHASPQASQCTFNNVLQCGSFARSLACSTPILPTFPSSQFADIVGHGTTLRHMLPWCCIYTSLERFLHVNLDDSHFFFSDKAANLRQLSSPSHFFRLSSLTSFVTHFTHSRVPCVLLYLHCP